MGLLRQSPITGGQQTVGQAADDLVEVLQRAALSPISVVSWSSGGLVALAMAAKRPGLIDRVVMVAAPAPEDELPGLHQDIKDVWAIHNWHHPRKSMRDSLAFALMNHH
jgi:pimeloyl-ACP methyl ester carboxylesterase